MTAENVTLTNEQFEKLMAIKAASISNADGNPTNNEAATADLYELHMASKYGQNRPNLEKNGVSVDLSEIMEDEALPTNPKKIQKMMAHQMTIDRAGRVLETIPAAEEFALACDYLYMVKGYLDGASKGAVTPSWQLQDTISYRTVQSMWKAISKNLDDRSKRALAGAGMLRRALDSATTNEGAEFIPTGFSNQVHKIGRVPRKVAGLFGTIKMPTDPWKWPLEQADATAYLTGEATSDTATKFTASTPGTSNITFASKKLAARVLWSAELEEDSSSPLPLISPTRLTWPTPTP
jgi:hypothetical protein